MLYPGPLFFNFPGRTGDGGSGTSKHFGGRAGTVPGHSQALLRLHLAPEELVLVQRGKVVYRARMGAGDREG